MPRNFKEALLFTILMCGMMVCGMSLWNLLILDWTGVVPFAWGHFFPRLSSWICGCFLTGYAFGGTTSQDNSICNFT